MGEIFSTIFMDHCLGRVKRRKVPGGYKGSRTPDSGDGGGTGEGKIETNYLYAIASKHQEVGPEKR